MQTPKKKHTHNNSDCSSRTFIHFSAVGDSHVLSNCFWERGIPSPVCPYHSPFCAFFVVGRSCIPGCALILLHPFRALSFVFGPFYPFKGQIGLMLLDSCVCTYSFLMGSFTLLTTTRCWCTRNIKVRASLQQHFGTPFRPTGLRMRMRSTSCVSTSLPIWRVWKRCVACDTKCLTPPRYEAPNILSQHGRSRRRRMKKTLGQRKDGVQRGEQRVCVARDNPNRQRMAPSISMIKQLHPMTRKDRLPQTLISVATWQEQLC